MTTRQRWVVTDSGGSVIASLVSCKPAGTLRRTMSRYESQSFTVPITSKVDTGWPLATIPGAGAVIGYTGDAGAETVTWGGIITQRVRDNGNVLRLSASTPEWYFDRRFTQAYGVTGRGQNQIVADLVALAAAGHPAFPGSNGWPFKIVVLDGAGTTRDRTYLDTDDKSIYSALTDLAGVMGGPQWMTGWEWQHNPERIVPVVTVGSRVGVAAQTGMAPPVAFTPRMMRPGGGLTEDYSSGVGANVVTAVSSGQGDSRPQQTRGIVQPRRPVYELRFTPSSSITALATLAAAAQGRVNQTANGSQTVACSLDRAAAPAVGSEWDLGDDASIVFDGPLFPEGPLTTTGQVIGYEVDEDTVTPYLAQEGGF